MGAGPDHLVRVRVEGDDHDRQAALGCGLRGTGDDALVTAVDAVEHADGDDAGAPVRGHLVRALPPLHVRFPLLVGR